MDATRSAALFARRFLGGLSPSVRQHHNMVEVGVSAEEQPERHTHATRV